MYIATAEGGLIVMDVHGNIVSKVVQNVTNAMVTHHTSLNIEMI